MWGGRHHGDSFLTPATGRALCDLLAAHSLLLAFVQTIHMRAQLFNVVYVWMWALAARACVACLLEVF